MKLTMFTLAREPSGGDEEPDHEDWEDEDNPDPYAIREDDAEDELISDSDTNGGGDESSEAGIEEDSYSDSDEWIKTAPSESSPRSPLLRPWTLESAEGLFRSSGSTVSSTEALQRIEAAELEFQYDLDFKAEAAYVLARTMDGQMGPLLVESVEALLAAENITVLRRGRRPGVARNGREYQHFFRIQAADGALPQRASVVSALRPNRTSEDFAASTTSLKKRPPHYEATFETLKAIEQAAQANRAALGALHINDRRLIGYRRSIQETQSLLHDSLKSIRDQRHGVSRLEPLEVELKTLREERSSLSEQIEHALSMAAEQERNAFNAAETLAWYEARYQEQLRSARDESIEAASLEIPAVERDVFVCTLLPDIRFLSDSIPVLWNETDRAEWLRLLTELTLDHPRFLAVMKEKGFLKRVAGQPEWWEVRRTRSAGDMARLYFTNKRPQLCVPPQRWVVKIHIKTDDKHQAKMIAALP